MFIKKRRFTRKYIIHLTSAISRSSLALGKPLASPKGLLGLAKGLPKVCLGFAKGYIVPFMLPAAGPTHNVNMLNPILIIYLVRTLLA